MKDKILIVDDESSILLALERNLRNHYVVVKALNGMKGLKALKEAGPFAAIISDYRMPQMNGVEFLAEAADITPDTSRIMLTGYADLDIAIAAINQDNIFHFLTKPCKSQDLMKVVEAAVRHYQLIISERELLQKTLTGSIRLLMDLFAAVQPDIFNRAGSISRIAKKVGERIGMKETWEIEMAASLSQIGTVTIPKELVAKSFSRDPLTSEEAALIKSHPQVGCDFLANIPRLENIAEAVKYQFKGYDGSGPPDDELQGEDIPLLARILKVVQDYDYHMTAGGNSTNSLNQLRAVSELYDPLVLSALESEILNVEKGHLYEVKQVNLFQLAPGMIPADNIYDQQGAILIPQGTVIGEVSKARLLNYVRVGSIEEPIRVIVRKTGQANK